MEIQTRNLDMYFERRVYIYPAVNLSPSPLHLPLITRTSAHGAVKPIDQAGPLDPPLLHAKTRTKTRAKLAHPLGDPVINRSRETPEARVCFLGKLAARGK